MLFLEGDVLDCLKSLPDQSVHCVVTSPPYMGLRNYGLPPTRWPSMDYHPIYGFTQHLDEETVCLGLEKTPESYIGHLVLVFRELRRVLRDDGTAWLNLGDSYAVSGRGPTGHTGIGEQEKRQGFHSLGATVPTGLKPKDLVGIPWRMAFALQADGWWLRSDTIWAKGASGQHAIWQNVYDSCLANGVPMDVAKTIADSADPYVGNPMPESVTDRPTRSHEYLFLLTKSQRYFYDHIAIQEDCVNGDPTSPRGSKGVMGSPNEGLRKQDALGKQTYTGFNDRYEPLLKRNRRDTWVIPTQAFPGSHFAVFPESLVEPCIKAGTSEYGCCPKCGAPFERIVEIEGETTTEKRNSKGYSDKRGKGDNLVRQNLDYAGGHGNNVRSHVTTGWHPTCQCNLPPIPCTVLDPFGGSGTVAKVSRDLGRDSIYCDLNPEYVQMAMERVGSSLFNSVEHRKIGAIS